MEGFSECGPLCPGCPLENAAWAMPPGNLTRMMLGSVQGPWSRESPLGKGRLVHQGLQPEGFPALVTPFVPPVGVCATGRSPHCTHRWMRKLDQVSYRGACARCGIYLRAVEGRADPETWPWALLAVGIWASSLRHGGLW